MKEQCINESVAMRNEETTLGVAAARNHSHSCDLCGETFSCWNPWVDLISNLRALCQSCVWRIKGGGSFQIKKSA
jgi:hypothetical protein